MPYCVFNTDESGDEDGMIKTYSVAPEMVACEGVAPQMCLKLKEEPFGEYELFYDEIVGFDYQEGTSYEIDVRVTKAENPPADASGYTYELININMTQELPDHTETQIALDASISQWATNGSENYTLTQQLSCFCMQEYVRPITYMVTDGASDRDSAMYADGDKESIDPDNAPELKTVVEAFALIQEAIDQYAYTITYEFDTTYGHPTMISIDYSQMMADEEAYYTFALEI